MRHAAFFVLGLLLMSGCAKVDDGTAVGSDGDSDSDSDTDGDTDSDGDSDSDSDGDTDTDTDTGSDPCGNDAIDGPEACDGTDLDGQDCGDFGFADGGVLECGDECDEFVLDDCVGGCGNNTVEGAETCDGTDLDGQDCTDFGYNGGVLECASDCDGYETGSCSNGCGNDTVEAGEICDGTDLDGESCATLGFSGGTLGCSAICDGFDLSGCTGGCGNGVQEVGEDCDGTDLNGQQCTTQGYYGGTLGCDSSCDFDYGSCSGTCGDNTADTGNGETCDGTDLNGQSCASYGYYWGTLLCNGACSGYITAGCSGFCGDNTANTTAGELCDGTDLNGSTCITEGYYGGTLTCNAGCNGFFYSGCTGYCGDGVIQAAQGEECDSSNLNGHSCATEGYYSGTLGCDSNCDFDTSPCSGYCGDGAVQAAYGEDCDGSNMGGHSCSTEGFYSGSVSCSAGCALSTSGCSGYCGDGTTQTAYGEQCDDGNTFSGDGCSPTCQNETVLVEDFETGTWPWSPWSAQTSGGTVGSSYAHDGSRGIRNPNWHYRTDQPFANTPGQVLSFWGRPDSSGRVYVGFNASSSGCRSIVLAPNTGGFIFQNNSGWGYTDVATVSHSWSTGWHRVEVEYNGGSSFTARLYDSGGTTQISTVTHDFGSTSTAYGIAIRAFNDSDIDTIAISSP